VPEQAGSIPRAQGGRYRTVTQLAALVEALLREIAAALAAEEVGNDQDHG